MWKSLVEVSHMFAHQDPSFHQRTLSARLVPVGSLVPMYDWSS